MTKKQTISARTPMQQFVRSSLDYCVWQDEQRHFPFLLESDEFSFWCPPVEISLQGEKAKRR